MGQMVSKRKPSIYQTSVWARKYRRDFEALQLTEEQVRLMWEEFCKVGYAWIQRAIEYIKHGYKVDGVLAEVCLHFLLLERA